MMGKKRIYRALLAAGLILICVAIAGPRFKFNNTFAAAHSLPATPDNQLNSQTADDCDFDTYNKPAYFNIFRFISNFIPVRPSKSGSLNAPALYFSQTQVKAAATSTNA
jgi:hypothetical protein